MVPLFAKHGIEIVSIGTNGANEAPDVPANPAGGANVFRWRVEGSEVFVLWHRSRYGGDKLTDCHIADDEALCPDWVGDNGGARSASSVKANFHAIQQEYPNAKVQTSTFDAFLPALKRANASLPVISSEGERGNLAPRIIDSVRLGLQVHTRARACHVTVVHPCMCT